MGSARNRGGTGMSEKQEAVNRDLLFLMIDREPRFLKRLVKRWLWCLR